MEPLPRAIGRAEESDRCVQVARVATAMILLHGLLAYPLRAAAMLSLFPIHRGLMSGIRPCVRPRKTERSARGN